MAQYAEDWQAALRDSIDELRPHVGSIVVLGDIPHLAASAPDCVQMHADYAIACSTPRSTAVSAQILGVEREVAGAARAAFIDPTDWLCGRENCPAVIGGFIAYMDESHLTIPFAHTLAKPLGAALGVVN